MKIQPKLILLNGFAGVGKTTIAKRYIDDHPLTLSIEGDEIIVMFGQWLTHEEQAREYVFALTKSMIDTHLRHGRTVLLPYLLTNAQHAEAFGNIAAKQTAHFYEIFLTVNKEDAIERLLARGVWGEAGSPALTEKDLPVITTLYDTMIRETGKRLQTTSIHPFRNDIDRTYNAFLEAIGER